MPSAQLKAVATIFLRSINEVSARSPSELGPSPGSRVAPKPALRRSCGKEERKILAAITSPAQDDVIEKILRARSQWDLPWKRQRKARGPAASEGVDPSAEAACIDRSSAARRALHGGFERGGFIVEAPHDV